MNENFAKQVRALYMEDPRDKHKSVITKVGSGEINKKNYRWIQLQETIFHPKGGGQLSDDGLIEGVKVAYVHKEMHDKNNRDKFEIYHCFEDDQPFNFAVGGEVELVVDTASRLLHSRLHTAGHVLAEAVNNCFPELEGYQGNHYPDNSYVKFKMLSPLTMDDKNEVKHQVEAVIANWIGQNPEVIAILDPSGNRIVKVFKNWVPCGGTHVKSLKEIGSMVISGLSVNTKEGTVTIKYCL